MRAVTVAGSIAVVASNSTPTLILELDRAGGDSIAGRVSTRTGTSIDFVGWLGLAGAIETALRDGEPTDDRQSTDGGSRS